MYQSPPFSITQRMLDLVFRIGERVSRMADYDALDPSPRLRKQSLIRSVYSSCAIEANSLSADQVSDVINGRRVLGPKKDIAEVRNAYAAYSELGRFDPYRMEDLLRMHAVMTEGTAEESGRFRSKGEGVFSGGECIFVAPPPDQVPRNMENLFAWLNGTRGTVNPLIASCVFHYELVSIHPFTDGNGRMARLWQTAILGSWKPIFRRISVENRIEMTQKEYYEAIDACNRAGSSDAFVEFMLQTILNAAEDADSILREEARRPPAQVRRLLDVMDEGVWYSSAQLREMVGMGSAPNFLRYYLKPAVDNGWVEREFPDSPRAPGQRYRLRTE